MIVLIIVLVYFVIGINERWRRTQEFQGQWSQFDSQNYFKRETFPDGFRLDYPASWSVSTYRKGIPQSREFRTRFTQPDNNFFSPDTNMSTYWQQVDEDFTLDDARIWFVEDVVTDISRSELEQKRVSFQEITVGKGNYPALTQTFVQFNGTNPHRQVVVLVVGDEAFAFSFHTKNYDEETKQVFKRMLDTLEIYE
jgi:hypothetical protein